VPALLVEAAFEQIEKVLEAMTPGGDSERQTGPKSEERKISCMTLLWKYMHDGKSFRKHMSIKTNELDENTFRSDRV